jgi:uncharacterized RDD family membrane protein YckC
MVVGEQLTIDTPEQVALELPVAGVGSRFLALAIDTLIQALLYLFLLVVFLALTVGLNVLPLPRSLGPALGPALLVLLAFAIYWGYFAAFEIAWQGQTPGKRLTGIRVIRDSGRPADVPAILLRNLLRAIDILPGMYAVGVVCMMLTRHARRIGDLVAGTVVVHDRPRETAAEFESAPPPAAAQTLPATLRLSDEELALVERYLGRRLELPLAVQERTAAGIARRLRDRHGAGPAPGQNLDDFLEAVARQTRDAARYR